MPKKRINEDLNYNIDILSQEKLKLSPTFLGENFEQKDQITTQIQQSNLNNKGNPLNPEIIIESKDDGKINLEDKNETVNKFISSLLYIIVNEVIESSPDYSFILRTLKSNKKSQNNSLSEDNPFLDSESKAELNMKEVNSSKIIPKEENIIIIKKDTGNIVVMDGIKEDFKGKNEDKNHENLNIEIQKSDPHNEIKDHKREEKKSINQSSYYKNVLSNSENLKGKPETNYIKFSLFDNTFL